MNGVGGGGEEMLLRIESNVYHNIQYIYIYIYIHVYIVNCSRNISKLYLQQSETPTLSVGK